MTGVLVVEPQPGRHRRRREPDGLGGRRSAPGPVRGDAGLRARDDASAVLDDVASGAVGLVETLSPVAATLTTAFCAISFLVAVVVAKVVNPVGTFVLGWGVAVMSMRMGTHLDLLFDGAAGPLVAVETLIWGGAVLLLATGVIDSPGLCPTSRGSRPGLGRCPDGVRSSSGKGPLQVDSRWWRSSSSPPTTPRASRWPRRSEASPRACRTCSCAGSSRSCSTPRPCVFLAARTGVGVPGRAEPVLGNWVDGAAMPLGIPMPVDVAAGGIMGVSIGIGWSRQFVEHHADS